jgi:hypothetical protein
VKLGEGGAGALGEIRTPDPRIRSPMLYPAELRARAWGSITRLGPTGPAACCRGRPGRRAGSGGGVWQKTSSPPSDAPRYVNARFHQVAKEFPHQQDVGFLQLVIVAEFDMTFIIEATKDDHHTVDIRSTAIVAVILARKLAADGYEVSIRSPTGRSVFCRSVQPFADEQKLEFGRGRRRRMSAATRDR